LARETRASFAFWFNASGWRKVVANLVQGRKSGTMQQEKQKDRDGRVARIQIYPGNATVDMNAQVQLSAVAYDNDNTPVGGVKIEWSGQDISSGRRPRITQRGLFEATIAGSFNVVAEGAGKTAAVTIVVRPGPVRNMNVAPINMRAVSTRDLPSTVGARLDSSYQSVARNSKRGASKTKRRDSFKRAHTSSSQPSPVSSSTASASVPLLPGDGWDDNNFLSADDPGNRVGNPPGGALDEGAGSGNFQIAAPVLGLPGRGIDISLGLVYNSRLWNKAGSEISFDNDRGWPAPGWSLGFGKILGMGVFNGGMIVDADGTRHGYSGTVTEFSSGTNFVGHTTDGTFIDYSYTSGVGGGIVSAQAKLPNGTKINYGAPGPGAVYPISIEDPNGNFIIITYVNNAGPRIQSIADTLNRPINFHYDSNNFLTAITGLGLNNTERTLVRLNYRQISLNYSFSGLTPGVRDPQPWVLNAVYYPGTNTGYWFGDSNSYSTYGMLARVSERRNMTFSAASLNDQGTVTYAGEITREEIYNYPLTTSDPGGSGLTDAPTYTSLTETWTRDGVNTDQAVTNYSSQPDASPRTVTITLPNGTRSTQYSHNYSSLPETDPLKALDGVVYQDQTFDVNNNLLQSSAATWQRGEYQSPRPVRVETTNELSQTTVTEFSYANDLYNQVTEVRNFDYNGGPLLRATRTQYQNSQSYTGQQTSSGHVGRHIFSLPLAVEVIAGDYSTRVSVTEYQYDGQPLTNTPGVVMHSAAYNPHAPNEIICDWWPNPHNPDQEIFECRSFNPYNPQTDFRGNVTRITAYANASSEPATMPNVEMRRYDINGNMVTASTSCCEQTSFNYTIDTQYAYPLSQTRGSATDAFAQVTTSAAYNFNTGLVLSATDANGRQSSTSYEAATLRPTTSTAPTDAHTDYAYNDAAMTVTSTTYTGPGVSAIADQNVKLLNGRGQVRQEQARAANNGLNQVWDFADVIYNNLGQVSQQSRPYRSGQTPQLSTAIYDALGRTTRVKAPDDSVTETYYNEKDFDTSDSYVPQRPTVASSAPGETTLVRDAWGRERWGRTDVQGRLVEVVEPNPSGSGSVSEAGALVTTYTYNTLGNLIQVNQGGQTRSFKYDSLGRLTAQKLAETSATLNDAGTYQTGGGGTWSDVFVYDTRSNLTSRTDARGVKTIYHFNNDPLNRLQSVEWNLSSPHENLPDSSIATAATVTYQYRHKNTATEFKDITQLEVVTTSGISTETYDFDSVGRVNFKRLVVNGRPAMDTSYSYDNLDRVTDVDYPAKNFAFPQTTRPRVHHNYDIASRLTSLTVDGATHASNIVYNAASQTTSLSVGAGGPNQIIESYNYDQQTGLLAGQTVARSSTPTNHLLNLVYDYADANGKRTGQLTKILNNINHNKDRSYIYDAFGRLVQAKSGPASAPLWTQTYTYDRYGNRTSVSASGNSASLRGRTDLQSVTAANGINPSMHRQASTKPESGVTASSPAITQPSDPQVSLPTDQVSAQTDIELPDSLRIGSSRSTSNSHHASRSTPTSPSPQGGPPVFTDPDLLASGVIIKALHITELRTAINDLRARLGMPAFSWQTSVTGLVNANPILEMRTALDQFLGPPPSPGYSAGLAQFQPILAIHIHELRNRVVAAWSISVQIPVDGHGNLSYDPATNRITTAGFAYDAAGNQVRALISGSSNSHRFQYDAANRLVNVKSDDNQTIIASYTYGNSNQRLILEEAGVRTYYACDSSAEYTETGSSTTPQWSKTYVYLGARLLSTLTPNGPTGHFVQYHHPDRLGTRLVTNAQDTNYFEQQTLPFGTALNESPPAGAVTGSTNKRFTTYDRSLNTGLDYALNRHYDPQRGRFTQVDPIGMNSTSRENPQTLNLYAYCTNDPINHTDPSGLGFFSFLKKVLRIVNAVLLTIAAILQPNPYSISAAVSAWIDVFGSPRLRRIANLVNSVIQSIGVRVKSSGDYWQGQEPIYDEGDVIRTTTNAPGPWWDEFLRAIPSSRINVPWLFGEWFTGGGPRSRRFDHKSVITQNLRTSPDVNTHRQRFCSQGQSPYNSRKHEPLRFGLNAMDGPFRAGINEGRQFVGSFELKIKGDIHGGALFVAKNRTSLPSALYHIPGVPDISRGGPLQTTTQYYWWVEGKPCK
jgi:RHS repeat-associated protein